MNIAPALHLGFSLVLLWGLLFFCWDEYRLDALRDKLFSLRHRLFMAAVEGHIAFDDPTYQQLRILMNGMIRFGHKLTFGRLMLACITQWIYPDPRWTEPMKQWRAEVQKLPEKQRNMLVAIHDDMFRAVMKHMAAGNPVVLLAFLLLVAIRLFVQILTRGAIMNLTVLKAGRDLHLNLIEAQALEAQEFESVYGNCGFART
jgi:hypothetical protein